jgi:hypothetical protein
LTAVGTQYENPWEAALAYFGGSEVAIMEVGGESRKDWYGGVEWFKVFECR